MNVDGDREPDRVARRWRKREWRVTRGRILRWSIAVLCWLAPFAAGRDVAVFIPAAWLALIGCVLVAPELASWLSRPFERLLWPCRVGKRKPSYGEPQTLVAKGEFERALAMYREIAGEFPDEVEPHIRMLTVAVQDMDDAERAEVLFQRGLAALDRPEDRDTLCSAYEELRAEAGRRRGGGKRRLIAVDTDAGPGARME